MDREKSRTEKVNPNLINELNKIEKEKPKAKV